VAVRRNHNQAEIEALAATFRESWTKGQIVKSWLRIHAGELRRLVHEEDWAWVNIGCALSLAGIAYRTGNAWSAENLRKAVILACKPTKRALREAARVPAQKASPALPMSAEPEFRIIRRQTANHETVASSSAVQPPPHAAPRTDLTDEEIFAIATGLPLKR